MNTTHSIKNINSKYVFKSVCGFLISASMLGSTVAPFYNVYADSAPSEPAWYQEYQENLKTVGGLLKISKDDAKNVADDLNKDGYLNDYAIKSVLENLQKVENMLNGGTFTSTEQSDLGYIYNVYQNLDLTKAVQDLNMEYSISDAQKDVQGTKEILQRLQGVPTSNEANWTAGLANFVPKNINTSFSDVSPSAWYYNEVTEAAKLGIINGMGDGTFSPESNLTVAQAMTLAAKVHAIYHDNMAELTQYDNVEGADWYSGAFAYARKYSLVDGNVLVNNKCTRQQMADMFAKVIDSVDFSSINDTSVLPTFMQQQLKGGMGTLFKSGIFVGNSSGFRPNEGISRAETAAIILRITTPSKRVTVTSETYTPKAQTNPSSTTIANTHYDLSTEAWKVQAQPKTVYVRPSDKYQSIQPKYSQPAEGLERIDTLYGGHTYGVNNQYEYDYVVNSIKETIANNPYESYTLDKYTQKYAESPIEGEAYFDTLTLAQGKNRMISSLQAYMLAFPGDKATQLEAYKLNAYVNHIASKASTASIASYTRNNSSSAYTWFVNPEGKGVGCVGSANLTLAVYDILGYNAATFGSNKRKHVDTGIQINGVWYVPACGTLLSSVENNDFYLQHADICSVEMIKTQTPDLITIIPPTVQ